jgi:serine/threonine protein kinase
MQLPDPQPLLDSYKQDGPMRAVLDQAYQQAATQLTDHQNGDGTLEIGGKTYAKDRHLAAGGFGSVDVYKAKDGEEIAVKTPIVNDPGDRAAKFEEAASEVRAHSSAVAGNPANVIGLKGVVRTPDGGIQIALELAPRGNAQDAIDKLNTAARRGQITPQEANLARLTILKDMIQGLHHVQETRGMTHLDIKGPNFFVDASGVTKLGDFGTARAGARQQLESNPIQNPRWAAPELVKGDSDRRSQVNAIHEQADAAFGAAAEKLKATLPSDALEVAHSDTKKTLRAERDHKTAAVPLINVTSKVDTWSIGVELYKAFTNKLPFDSDSSFPVSDIQEAQKAFTDRGAKLRLPPEKNLFGLERTQFGQLNTLVGELMHPDPQQRPTLTQALQNPLFQLPGVGGAQARAIIQQVTT